MPLQDGDNPVFFYANGSYIGTGVRGRGNANLTTTSLPVGSLSITATVDAGEGYFSATSTNTFIQTVNALLTPSTFEPLYKITSILYSPPGNKSSQGYTTTTTNGTTTTLGSTFGEGFQISYTAKFTDLLSAGGSWGYSQSTNNTSAFTQTWADAINYATTDNGSSYYNPSGSNSLGASLDTFMIWTNPLVTVNSNGATPVSYTVSSIPSTINDETVYEAMALPVPAISMEAQPAGVTQMNPSGVAGVSGVSFGNLLPEKISQINGNPVLLPGIGNICANNSIYQQELAWELANPLGPQGQYCSQANQCGCQPSDFVTIEERDPLLNYSASTYTGNPEPTVSPMAWDVSGESVCGADQPPGYAIPSGSDCRYVIVPQEGTNTPINLLLSGAGSQGYSESDSFSSSFTTTQTDSYDVQIFFQAGPVRVTGSWNWSDSQGVGTSTGGTNTMSTTLNTSTGGCSEEVALYEDTVYHTFAYQTPTGIGTCP